MGEMADYEIQMGLEQMLDGEYTDAYDGPDGGTFARRPPFSRWCNYCGKSHLDWKQTDFGWRLIDKTGEIHSCDQYRAAKQAARNVEAAPF